TAMRPGEERRGTSLTREHHANRNPAFNQSACPWGSVSLLLTSFTAMVISLEPPGIGTSMLQALSPLNSGGVSETRRPSILTSNTTWLMRKDVGPLNGRDH